MMITMMIIAMMKMTTKIMNMTTMMSPYLHDDIEALRCFGRLNSIDFCSWLALRGELELDDSEDWEMFEIVLFGLNLALGEHSSVRLALRTGGIPLIP